MINCYNQLPIFPLVIRDEFEVFHLFREILELESYFRLF